MGNGRIAQRLTWPWNLVTSLASVWLLFVFVLTKIVGPLNPDEIYFSHGLWLSLHGQRPLLDFYSQHLPAYFWLYELVIPPGAADGLDFLWIIRGSNVLVLAAYVAVLFAVARRFAIALLPLLLLLVTFSRSVEVRSDTLGLLAFNAAWAVLLTGRSRRSGEFATLLALIAVTFSVRALVVGIGFGAALAWRGFVTRDAKSLVVPAAMLACSLALGVTAYLIEPRYVEIMLDSTLVSPSGLLVHVPIAQRLFALDRSPQIAIAIAALLLGSASAFTGRDRLRAGIVAIASLTQLVLILVDPSPFPYVYAWALIPSLVGLTLADGFLDARTWLAVLGIAGAGMVACAIFLYPVMTGRQAAVGSNYRLLPDAGLQQSIVRRLSTVELIRLMLSRDHQQSLSNQLLVREELCRRFPGTALSAWQSHPICMRDATYYWFSVKWPNIGDEGAPPEHPGWFAEIFQNRPPDLFIWNSGTSGVPIRLSPWVMNLLADYQLQEGFAVRRVSKVAIGSSDRGASRPNNVPR